MGSKREEERNEKIIRGLMKLPPNRRCINCNSLGPQYVCTNFWTFVCMTCSGIHREFTHRVKSVSMAKFTSQEVEALQNGGNQRAREIYLRDWDPQRQRLPDSSNADKVRQFIKNVYVDRKYAGGKNSEKPPRDLQRLASQPDDTRRASSYHSYSQSPPYDYQYEERRYGKHGVSLTRKPGSDRGHYIWKSSSFVYSPGRMSEQMFEDRFANESSSSRVSDYSVSSGGDLFRSGRESPNFQIQPSKDASSPNANFKREIDAVPRPQRTVSSGSIGSLGSNSFKSFNSGGLGDVVSEHEQAAVPRPDKISRFPQSSVPVSYGGLDLFQQQVVQEPVSTAAPSIDLFNLAAANSPVNTLQASAAPAAPSANIYQPHQTYSSLDLFETAGQPSSATLDKKTSESSTLKNEGWATFDSPAPVLSISGSETVNPAMVYDKGVTSVKFEQLSSFNTTTEWQAFPNYGVQGPAPSADPWFGGLHYVETPNIAASTQSWNAFDDCIEHLPLEGVEQSSKQQLGEYKLSSSGGQSVSPIVAEALNNDEMERAASLPEPPVAPVASHTDIGESCSSSVLPQMGEKLVHATDRKSANPFDFPYDSDLEPRDLFLEMNSLHAALPNAEPPIPSTFLGGVAQPWFPQNPISPLIQPAAQGSLAYMSGQAPSPQLPNVPTQEPVASVGGNPFA